MYVPPLDAVLKNLGIDRKEFDNITTVKVPVSLLKFLLQVTVAAGDFDEDGYLASNPDLELAAKRNELDDLRMHYVRFGYFEGRQGATQVDEEWYREKYPDVAKVIRSGGLRSAAEHFAVQGASEGRSPSSLYEPDAQQWKKAFGVA
jgi:hypothetical protein